MGAGRARHFSLKKMEHKTFLDGTFADMYGGVPLIHEPLMEVW
jgi:hypothetical protein